MEKSVTVGARLLRRGIESNHRGFPDDENFRVIGMDTESVKGEPWTLQWDLGEGPELLYVSRRTILDRFIELMEGLPNPKKRNLVFFHYLHFDIPILFYRYRKILYDQMGEMKEKYRGWTFTLCYGKVNFGKAQGPDGRTVSFIDSWAFCAPGSKSLEGGLKTYGIEGVKLEKPKGLGQKKLKSKAFETYAKNDVTVEKKLGEAILELHRQYDVSPCVSLPHLAGKVLRHQFFKPGESIRLPPKAALTAAEFSYHAGKNGFYAEPGILEDVNEYDINSAFPYAMRELPQMVRGTYEPVRDYAGLDPGVYEVSGKVTGVKYPALYDHAFRPILGGDFKKIWVTGWEVELMREDKSYDFEIRQGWKWKADPRYTHNPLREFVNRFWELKNTTPKGPKRDAYKNILNSLYGKFAGTIEEKEIIQGTQGQWIVEKAVRTWRAQSMYHPFIAGQITGYVRREITRLEREGHALHTATDSIKTLKTLPTSNALGRLKLEVAGRCYFFRNKLYLHFAKDSRLCGHDPANRITEDGQHLCKAGLHGFKGDAKDLYRRRHELLKNRYLDYTYRHMVSLREGTIRKEKVCAMIKRRERLTLRGLDYARS